MMKLPGHGPAWMLVLPDQPEAANVSGQLSREGVQILQHPSGRPWLLVCAGAATMTSVRAGIDRHLVLLGPGSVDTAGLATGLAGSVRPDDVERRLAALPGSFHVALRIGKRLRIRGTASDICRVYYRTLPGGVIVAGTRADLLATLTGVAAVDEEAVAMRLLEPVPHPISDLTTWRKVDVVPAGHSLDVDESGRGALTRWWSVPPPTKTISEGIPILRSALVDSIRSHLGRPVSSELSGGLDSTTVTALAVRVAEANSLQLPSAVTARGRDPLDDDWSYALAATREIPQIQHHVLEPDQLPLVYAGLDEESVVGPTHAVIDEPAVAAVYANRVRALVRHAGRTGAEVHLTGHGGDNLFVGHPTLCLDLLRTSPLAAMRRIAAYRGMFGWSLPRSIGSCLGASSYRRWLRCRAVTKRVTDSREPLLSWGVPATLRPWLTASAVTTIRSRLASAAEAAEPLARTRGRHTELDGVRDGGRMVRALAMITAPEGPLLTAPLLDDRVVEATLAIRIEDRATPWSYKPLLRAAAGADLPRAVDSRTSKGVGTLDDALGLVAHQRTLSGLFTGSRLGSLGIVDDALLRELLSSPTAPALLDGALLSTLSVELWLRSLEVVSPWSPAVQHSGPIRGSTKQ